jgi:hypothetical protein
MKKVFQSCLGVFFFALSKGWSLYLGNPATCELPQEGVFFPEETKVALKVGYQTQAVLDRKMELIAEQRFLGGSVDQVSLGFDQGVLVFNIVDRLEIIATLGSMRLSLNRQFIPGVQLALQTHSSFVWSIGGQSMLILWGNTSLGVVANYLSSHPTPELLLFNQKSYSKRKTSISYNTWQIEVALSQKIDVFSVYLGGAYSYAELQIASDIFKKIAPNYLHEEKYKNRHALSMVMGVSLAANKAFTMNFEAQAFGQTAIGMRMEFRF